MTVRDQSVKNRNRTLSPCGNERRETTSKLSLDSQTPFGKFSGLNICRLFVFYLLSSQLHEGRPSHQISHSQREQRKETMLLSTRKTSVSHSSQRTARPKKSPASSQSTEKPLQTSRFVPEHGKKTRASERHASPGSTQAPASPTRR